VSVEKRNANVVWKPQNVPETNDFGNGLEGCQLSREVTRGSQGS
jgi:hypothetical protein